ncbi:unnamed protein product [Sphagnum jensenii]
MPSTNSPGGRDFKIPEASLDEPIAGAGAQYSTLSELEENKVHHNLRHLSHSGLQLLHSCPRKFELVKLSSQVRLEEDEGGHLSFGTVVGNGIQEYLVSGNRDRALFRVFLDWKESIDEEKALKNAKTFWHAIHAVDQFSSFNADTYSGYSVAYFQGKPAVELGFSIDCGDGFFYRGKLDALLIHKVRQEFLIVECKTTGSATVDEAMYKNSGQALGYGLVVDRIAYDLGLTNSYAVSYPVYKTKSREWQEFRFPKSPVQRSTWLQSILIEVGQIMQYVELDYFPPHGESCYSYFRQCQFFGVCNLSNDTLIGDLTKVAIRKDKEEDYPFKFSIQELIEAQLEDRL